MEYGHEEMFKLLTAHQQWYLDHQEELVMKYEGQFIVTKDYVLIGSYYDQDEAIEETEKQYPEATYIIQKCGPDKSQYPAIVFSSNCAPGKTPVSGYTDKNGRVVRPYRRTK